MKHTVKYRLLTIPSKLSVDIRVIMDSTSRYPSENVSESNGDRYTTLALYPFIGIGILRPPEKTEDGSFKRSVWNPNDNLSMTRYQLPVFIGELEQVLTSMRVPEMYSYSGSRLLVNETLAETARRAFRVSPTMMIELLPVVVTQEDDTRIEGIRMKYNNDSSIITLTLNDSDALLFTLKTMNIDSIVMLIHCHYLREAGNESKKSVSGTTVTTDIVPNRMW